ncbi:hypothetical protein LIPSTDRAFT_134427 [Lipomyces starkeyi NRRL Y-11557]|uniref:Uncharacterized protein n=1 Tax=Lipomyces starkeyi NRRL Y-11557 TaxID=675824 RepID=A0A1E3QFM0_LIPST|nr:hypothetical protein LIPSTDRAFT_134427 [Lipomyces starkeyi NRRL Y-11557]
MARTNLKAFPPEHRRKEMRVWMDFRGAGVFDCLSVLNLLTSNTGRLPVKLYFCHCIFFRPPYICWLAIRIAGYIVCHMILGFQYLTHPSATSCSMRASSDKIPAHGYGLLGAADVTS